MRIYYGWVIVALSMLVLMLALGTTMNAFGLFILPVSSDFGLSRANVSTGVILINVGMAVTSPVVGRILDLSSARKVMCISIVLFAGSLCLLGISSNAWLSAFLLAVPLSVGLVGLGTLTSLALVARWFTVNRGRAIAFTSVGMSLGGVLVVPVVGLLIDALGWRQSLIILGSALGLLFLMLLPFVRNGPKPGELENSSIGQQVPEAGEAEPLAATRPLRVSRLVAMPQFWTVALSAALTFGALQSIGVAFVPLAHENGVSTTRAAGLLSVMGVASIAGNLLFAWIGDRLDRTKLLTALFSLVAPTSAFLLFAGAYYEFMVCGVCFGLVAGAVTPAFVAQIADRFGTASFGTANGAAVFIISIVSAICIRYGGEVYDWSGSYDVMFRTFIVVALLAAALMYATRFFVRQPTPLGNLVPGGSAASA